MVIGDHGATGVIAQLRVAMEPKRELDCVMTRNLNLAVLHVT